MSDKKHIRVLNELSAHPIARNIEWSELIPALATIGVVQAERNGNYHFTRGGHTISLERANNKTVDIDEVLKLRHFLHASAVPESSNSDHVRDAIVAIDHHQATIYHDPGAASESRIKVHADTTKDRILHTHPTHAPFKDSGFSDDPDYYESVMREIITSKRIVILSHGTGTSSAASELLTVINKKHPELASKVVAVKTCDLEAMTEPQLVQLGTEALYPTNES